MKAIAGSKSAFYLNVPKLDIKPTPAMPKLPQCDRCLLYARNPHLICAVHPAGPNTDTCLDFRADPNLESDELWEPEGASYYNGELILQPRQRWTLEEQLELLARYGSRSHYSQRMVSQSRMGYAFLQPARWWVLLRTLFHRFSRS